MAVLVSLCQLAAVLAVGLWSAGESGQGGPSVNVNLLETITVSDAPQVLAPVSIDVQETITVSDLPAILPQLSIQVQENILVSDSVSVLPGLRLRILETITVQDAPVLDLNLVIPLFSDGFENP